MLESVERLRRYALCKVGERTTVYSGVEELADDIEREIEERYMPLPVDADGVPWSFADKQIIDEHGHKCWLTSMRVTSYGRWELGTNCKWHLASDCRHVKPRTLEDVLTDLVNEVAREGHQIGLTASEIIGRYADEIRELIGGDEK